MQRIKCVTVDCHTLSRVMEFSVDLMVVTQNFKVTATYLPRIQGCYEIIHLDFIPKNPTNCSAFIRSFSFIYLDQAVTLPLKNFRGQ